MWKRRRENITQQDAKHSEFNMLYNSPEFSLTAQLPKYLKSASFPRNLLASPIVLCSDDETYTYLLGLLSLVISQTVSKVQTYLVVKLVSKLTRTHASQLTKLHISILLYFN